MFVRVSRYRVLPEKLNQYLSIQEQAGRIYQKYELIRASYFQNANDASVWLEVHWYPDEPTCRRITAEINAEPKVGELWRQFQNTLDPTYELTVEEYRSPVR